jgi:hypothetical protein
LSLKIYKFIILQTRNFHFFTISNRF